MEQCGTYTMRELAARLGVNERTVRDLARRGELPFPVLRLGRRMVVPIEPVERALRGEEEGSP
ncbi:MAG: helix-turn-helix domain-containing protein [Acidimicrobiia bacterium]|nr:helix-turn-helix domain-containing protein [Acidimicrobiia bacterium]